MSQPLLLVLLKRSLGYLLYWLAQLFMPWGVAGKAIARLLLTATVALWPGHTHAQAYHNYLQALKLFPQGETDQALGLLQQASRAVPDDEALHLDWGVALAMAGRHGHAIDVLEQLAKDSERAVGEQQLWNALGWSYLRTGRYPLAEKVTKRAADNGISNTELRLILSLALLGEQGWIDQATLQEILRKRPRVVGMVLEFIYALAAGQKRKLAAKLLGALPAQLQPRALNIAANLSFNDDDLDTAQWALEQLRDLEPESVPGRLLACEIGLRQGDLATAAHEVRAAVAQEPEDLRALEVAGRAMTLCGDHQQAFEYMTTALAKGSRDALAGGVVALHLLAEDRFQDARKVFALQRTGDELACVYAHTATAWLLQHEGEPAQVMGLAEMAYDFWQELPGWARTEAVCSQILPRLKNIVQTCRDVEDEASRQAAAELLGKLEEAERASAEDASL